MVEPCLLQCQHWGKTGSIFASTVGEAGPLLKAAAGMAFGSFPKTAPTRLTTHLGAQIDKKASLFQILKALLQHVLHGTADAKLEDILLRRVRARDVYEEFLETQEMNEHIGEVRADEEVVTACQEIQKVRTDVASFAKELKTSRLPSRPPTSRHSPKSAASSSSHAGRRKAIRLKENCIELEVQSSMSPLHRIYTDDCNGCWGQYVQSTRCGSKSWQKYGHKQAALLIFSLAWAGEQELGGAPCPWDLASLKLD